jgi:hypothetical protein
MRGGFNNYNDVKGNPLALIYQTDTTTHLFNFFRNTMAYPHSSALKFSILSIFVASALTGCGGGGAGGSGSGEVVSSTSVFAEPSGPFCAIKNGDICIEPTSSGTTLPQLLAALTDPQGPTFQLTRYGNRWTTHTKLGEVALEGSSSYDSSEKTLVFSRNKILMDGKTYAFGSVQPDGSLQFVAGAAGNPFDVDAIVIPPLMETAVVFVQYHAKGSVTGAGTPNMIVTSDMDGWLSFFGLLTDKADVNLPADNTIRYRGTVNFIAGNGAPLPSSTSLNVTDVRCPISLTLDTKFGKLVSNAAVCTDDKGGTLDFSLRDLYIKDSRIFGNLGNEALAAVNGFPLEGDLRTTARVVTVTPLPAK